MKRKTNCCYKCEDRSEACHVTCEKYAEFVKKRDEAYERRKLIEQSAPQWSKHSTDKIKRNMMDKPRRVTCK